jgi:hypothetical protein
MKRIIRVLGIAVLAIAVTASAAFAGKSTLKTFGTGVTVDGNSATIVTTANGDGTFTYGGVYLQSKSNSGKLADVNVSFTSTGDVTGGAPRFSLPIDDPATTAKVDGYAFMDAANCGGVSGGSTLVSTESGTCPVFLGSGSWANWDAFVAANPTLRLSPGEIPFIVADGAAGTYKVEGIVLR